MRQRTQAQVIETFHLLFLRVLAARRSHWFTLKGGANLRYFFGSPRYSNDIDLDVDGRTGWQVTKSVTAVLDGPALSSLMRASRIEAPEVVAAKQTDTTQRWKIGLRTPDHPNLIRTKVEFSGRGGEGDGWEFAVVPDEIVRPYALQAPTVRHYLRPAAISQKIAALALRSETKARDVFDLELLLRQHQARQPSTDGLAATHAAAAAERALLVPFAAFTTEVAPFLDPDLADLYDRATWEGTCSAVARALATLAERTPPPEPGP